MVKKTGIGAAGEKCPIQDGARNSSPSSSPQHLGAVIRGRPFQKRGPWVLCCGLSLTLQQYRCITFHTLGRRISATSIRNPHSPPVCICYCKRRCLWSRLLLSVSETGNVAAILAHMGLHFLSPRHSKSLPPPQLFRAVNLS